MLPQNHRNLHRKMLALAELCRANRQAVTLVFTILDMWLEQQYPKLLTSRGNKRFRQNKLVREFASELGALAFLDGAFWLSCCYANWVGTAVRKEKAMFFTPPDLAGHVLETLARQGASFAEHRWFDPACGGAAFLAPLALRMREELLVKGCTELEVLQHITENIVGFDIDETLTDLTVIFLKMIVYKECEATGYEYNPKITATNTLSLEPSSVPKFDVLIANPPYRKLTLEDKVNIRPDYAGTIEGQHNIYGVFMAAAVKACKGGELLALLTPTSYISGRHFAKLRSLLSSQIHLLQLDMLAERDAAFIEVEQEIAILYGCRVECPDNNNVAVTVLGSQRLSKSVGSVALSPDGDAWYVPRSNREYTAFLTTASAKARLSDYGYVPRIGSLVWNRDRRPQLFSTDEVAAAGMAVPVIWSSNITAEGEFVFGRASGQKSYFSFVDFGDSKNHGLVSKECVILQRVTSTDQTRRLIAAVVPKAFIDEYGPFVAENHVVVLVPIAPRVPPHQLKDLLMTEEVNLLFRCLSGTVGVTIYELNQLPLPNPAELRRLLEKGEKVSDVVKSAYEKSVNLEESVYGT